MADLIIKKELVTIVEGEIVSTEVILNTDEDGAGNKTWTVIVHGYARDGRMIARLSQPGIANHENAVAIARSFF